MFLLFAGRVIQVILTVLQIRLATTLLGPSQYGSWIMILTTSTLFILFGISPFGLYLNRHVIDWQSKSMLPAAFKGYSGYLVLFSVLMTAVSSALVSLGFLNFGDLGQGKAVLLICLLMMAQTFHQTWIPTLNFLGDRKGFVFGTCAGVALGILSALGLSSLGIEGVAPWALSIAFGFIVSTFIFIPKSWPAPSGKRVTDFFKSIELKDVGGFAGPLFITTLFTWGQTQGYRLLVENKLGLADLGKFAAGYSVVAGLIGALEGVLSSFYQANFFQRIGRGDQADYVSALSEVWKVTLYPYAMAASFLYLTAPALSSIFLGDKFTGDMQWLSFVAVSEGGRLVFNLLTVHFHGRKETRKLIMPQLIGVALSLGLILGGRTLSFVDIIMSLGAGYLLSIAALCLSDLKAFHASAFFKTAGTAALVSLIFLFIGMFTATHLQGPYLIAAVSAIAGCFMLPYLKHHLRTGQ